MAEEIKQELGFDAHKALQTLNDLNNVMGTFEQRIGGVVKRLDAFNRAGKPALTLLKGLAREGGKAAAAMSKLTGAKGPGTPGATAKINPLKGAGESATEAANRVIAAMAKIEAAAKKNLGSAGKSTRKLTVDFQTMVRIISTQVIVRALSTLRNLLRGAVGDAIRFQTEIAEIGTIAPTDDLSDLADRVREVSDAFNVPLEAASKGYYQTISNQIGSTTDEFDTFLRAAAKFSKVSVTDIKSAVDLGSGALNAFGKSASDAEEVFAKFFVTIKQGRVVGRELAQGYGQIAPLAEALGVELEEANAALATITINGVAADKAFTQLRGVFNSFLKPTKEMTAAMREVGFATSEQLFQAHDLQAALRLVISTTDGSIESISKLVPRVRGLTGAISLANDETEHFTETMTLQQEKLDEIYARGYKLVMDTDAQRVTKELNQLKNFMTTEFGEGVLEAASKFFSFAGGADQLERILEAIGAQIPRLVFGLGALGAALAVVAVRSSLAKKGLNGMIGPMGLIAAIPAAIALGDFIGSSVVESWGEEHRTFLKFMDKQEQARKEKAAAELAVERQKVKELEQLFAREFAVVRKHLFKISDLAVETNKTILSDTEFFSDGIIREVQKTARAYRSAFESMGKDVRDSEGRTADLQIKLDDRVFNQRIKKQSDIHRVYALTDRATRAGIKAADQLSKAVSSGDRGDASDEFKRAEAFAKQALQIAEGTENRALEAKVLATMETLTKKNIRAEEAYQKTIANSQIQMASRAKVEERRVADLKVKQKELLEAFTLYDAETGELLDFKARGVKLKGAQKTLKEFIELSTKGKPLDVGQMMDFASLSTEMSREMSDFRIEQLQASASALTGLSLQVQNSLDEFKATIPAIQFLEADTGIEITGPTSESEAVSKLTREYDDLLVKKHAMVEADNEMIRRQFALDDSLKKLKGSYSGIGVGTAQFTTAMKDVFFAGKSSDLEFWEDIASVLTLLNRGSKDATVSLEELHTARLRLKDAEKGQSYGTSVLTGSFKQDVENAVIALEKLIKARGEASEVDTGDLDFEAISARIQEIGAAKAALEQPAANATTMATATGDAQLAMANAVSPANLLENSWRNIAVSAQIAATASSNLKSPAMAAHGGMTRYLASGGAARGMDQIPAMLSKGEFVVNEKSSRQFYSQLSAMNAGMKPVFRESGGSVTTIGDVSISVTEAKSSQATAREVMKAFRREQRRGSGRL